MAKTRHNSMKMNPSDKTKGPEKLNEYDSSTDSSENIDSLMHGNSTDKPEDIDISIVKSEKPEVPYNAKSTDKPQNPEKPNNGNGTEKPANSGHTETNIPSCSSSKSSSSSNTSGDSRPTSTRPPMRRRNGLCFENLDEYIDSLNVSEAEANMIRGMDVPMGPYMQCMNCGSKRIATDIETFNKSLPRSYIDNQMNNPIIRRQFASGADNFQPRTSMAATPAAEVSTSERPRDVPPKCGSTAAPNRAARSSPSITHAQRLLDTSSVSARPERRLGRQDLLTNGMENDSTSNSTTTDISKQPVAVKLEKEQANIVPKAAAITAVIKREPAEVDAAQVKVAVKIGTQPKTEPMDDIPSQQTSMNGAQHGDNINADAAATLPVQQVVAPVAAVAVAAESAPKKRTKCVRRAANASATHDGPRTRSATNRDRLNAAMPSVSNVVAQPAQPAQPPAQQKRQEEHKSASEDMSPQLKKLKLKPSQTDAKTE